MKSYNIAKLGDLATMNQSISWSKVIAIALIQGSITLTWIVYNLYLPDFLKTLGLSASLAQIILVIEHFLEVIIEPIAGNFSDQQERRIGTNLPMITVGIILGSSLFFLLPGVVIFGDEGIKWLLIIMAILWASAMAIFRAPVMSLLRKVSRSEKLVEAASLLTLFSSIVGALQFDVFEIILKMGAPFAFFLSSVILIGSGFAIQRVFPPDFQDENTIIANELNKKIPLIKLIIISFTGLFVGIGLRFFYGTLTQVFNSQLGDQSKLAMMLFSIILGISALLTGKIANKLGKSQGLFLGTIMTAIFLPILAFIPVNIITNLAILSLLISFSFVLNGVLPFILNITPDGKTGFGMGLYFGCFGGGISLFILLSNYLKFLFTNLTPQINSIGGLICFAIASVFIYLSSNQNY